MNNFYNLPDDVMRLIWDFDGTYKEKYNYCVKQLKSVKKLHIQYKKNNYRRIKNIPNFTGYYLNYYLNKAHSKTLFKYYNGEYSNILIII